MISKNEKPENLEPKLEPKQRYSFAPANSALHLHISGDHVAAGKSVGSHTACAAGDGGAQNQAVKVRII